MDGSSVAQEGEGKHAGGAEPICAVFSHFLTQKSTQISIVGGACPCFTCAMLDRVVFAMSCTSIPIAAPNKGPQIRYKRYFATFNVAFNFFNQL